MSLRLSASDRDRLKAIRTEKAEILKPLKLARKAEQEAARRARPQRETRIEHDTGKQTRGRDVDKVYRAWVRQFGCVAGLVRPGSCKGPIEAAHLRFSDFAAGRQNPGMARKSDDHWVTPLCRHHHQGDQHKRSERAFWAELGIDVNALCRDLRAAYPDPAAGAAVLRQHARSAA